MRMPAIDLAEALAERGESAHHYIFAAESPWDGGALGSPHAIIIGFVFGTHAFSDASAAFFGRGTSADALSANVQDALVALAASGSPRTAALADWLPYDTAQRSTAIFQEPPSVVSAPYDEETRPMDGPGSQPALRCATMAGERLVGEHHRHSL